jgi:hypothetical protein
MQMRSRPAGRAELDERVQRGWEMFHTEDAGEEKAEGGNLTPEGGESFRSLRLCVRQKPILHHQDTKARRYGEFLTADGAD